MDRVNQKKSCSSATDERKSEKENVYFPWVNVSGRIEADMRMSSQMGFITAATYDSGFDVLLPSVPICSYFIIFSDVNSQSVNNL